MSEDELAVQLAVGSLSKQEVENIFIYLPSKTSENVLDLIYRKLFTISLNNVDTPTIDFKYDVEDRLWTHPNLSKDTITYCLSQIVKVSEMDGYSVLGSDEMEYNIKKINKRYTEYEVPFEILTKLTVMLSDVDLLKLLVNHPKFDKTHLIDTYHQCRMNVVENDYKERLKTMENILKELNATKTKEDLLNTLGDYLRW